MNFLTMNIYVNAWLDCHNPHISIHNKFDGDLMAFFNSQKVSQLIESGEVSVSDFESSDENTRSELISTLLSFKFSDSMKDEFDKKMGSKTSEKTSQSGNDLVWT
ncbi:hypothetical protein GCM10009133_27060 [Cocleimonas flava]|uniref:Uncharacterized protein n=1 Tax=Cocleimonas flava TaxID=634765 RepID=A0A4R1EYX2_9GAMM|nr:hypothetical protein [Cocleimonas flava]TCJ83241.1 hypothetical protein EV695_3981 [Cocleimonas flava]